MAGAAGLFQAAGDIVGGIIGSDIANNHNTAMQNRQIKWEREKLGLEQDYATKMSNTAHQREMADLKAAGINPILTGMGGGGANTPTPQAGSITALPDQSGGLMATGITSAMGHMMESKKIDAEVKTMEHQYGLIDAEKLKAVAETGLVNKKKLETIANTALLKSQRDLIDEQWNKAIQESQLAYYQVQTAYEELQYAKQNAKNKAEILAAEKNLKIAETNMKQKEDKMWYFTYIWDKGIDIGKLATNIFGVSRLANSAKTLNETMKRLPGIQRR